LPCQFCCMEINCTYLPYEQTGYFSNLVIDYINADKQLEPFYKYPVNINGVLSAIKERQKFAQQRNVLVSELRKQYDGVEQHPKVAENMQLLLKENTFTVTTAHQPNIFTGPLYFIYKILHAVKVAHELNKQLPDYNFVPVYYMGSEDADLEELGSITIDGVNYTWQTKQTGAVGRMKVDKPLINLIDAMHGQLGVLPYGEELIELFRKIYATGKSIQQATLELVNHLFGDLGLVVLIPDNPNLKKLFQPIIEKELKEQFSNHTVNKTIAELEKHYRPQAAGRELNLFYLINDKRERIEVANNKLQVSSLNLEWKVEEILQELNDYPERFSPNVILRGALQETILPNIIFIGGGGELAYWLELKNVFEAVKIPYPLLILRNSFVLIENKYSQMIQALGLKAEDMFQPEHELMKKIVINRAENKVKLNGELQKAEHLYDEIMHLAGNVDATLKQHVEALKTKAVYRLRELEKKMLRAEKKKFSNEQQQLLKIKAQLFPNNSLQERIENVSLFYARYGKQLLNDLYQNSASFAQQFAIACLNN
jgi:bacillithiol biosynthesis cysteine-adding enzyme BshC